MGGKHGLAFGKPIRDHGIRKCPVRCPMAGIIEAQKRPTGGFGMAGQGFSLGSGHVGTKPAQPNEPGLGAALAAFL